MAAVPIGWTSEGMFQAVVGLVNGGGERRHSAVAARGTLAVGVLILLRINMLLVIVVVAERELGRAIVDTANCAARRCTPSAPEVLVRERLPRATLALALIHHDDNTPQHTQAVERLRRRADPAFGRDGRREAGRGKEVEEVVGEGLDQVGDVVGVGAEGLAHILD